MNKLSKGIGEKVVGEFVCGKSEMQHSFSIAGNENISKVANVSVEMPEYKVIHKENALQKYVYIEENINNGSNSISIKRGNLQTFAKMF